MEDGEVSGLKTLSYLFSCDIVGSFCGSLSASGFVVLMGSGRLRPMFCSGVSGTICKLKLTCLVFIVFFYYCLKHGVI